MDIGNTLGAAIITILILMQTNAKWIEKTSKQRRTKSQLRIHIWNKCKVVALSAVVRQPRRQHTDQRFSSKSEWEFRSSVVCSLANKKQILPEPALKNPNSLGNQKVQYNKKTHFVMSL